MVVLSPAVARAARAYTGLSHAQLGKAAGVASRTVFKLEKDGNITAESLAKIVAVLEGHGVVFSYGADGRVAGMDFRAS